MKESTIARHFWKITIVFLVLASCRLPMNVTPDIPSEGRIQTSVVETMAAMAIEGAPLEISDDQAPQEVVVPTGTMIFIPTITPTPTPPLHRP